MDLIQLKAHRELHKKIYDCNCKPYLRGEELCNNCTNAIVEFAKEHGAGVLTRDIEIETLKARISKLEKECSSLLKRLEDKIRRVEELKDSQKTSEAKNG